MRNCRACHASYDKSTGYCCSLPSIKDAELLEPIGFCEFCDRNNEAWYMPQKDCISGKENCTCIYCRRKRIADEEK